MTERFREAVLSSHRDTIEACIEAGRRVAATWPEDSVGASEQVVGPLEDRLQT